MTFSTEALDNCARHNAEATISAALATEATVVTGSSVATLKQGSIPTPKTRMQNEKVQPTDASTTHLAFHPLITGPVAFYAAHWHALAKPGPDLIPNTVQVRNCLPLDLSLVSSPPSLNAVICQSSMEKWEIARSLATVVGIQTLYLNGVSSSSSPIPFILLQIS